MKYTGSVNDQLTRTRACQEALCGGAEQLLTCENKGMASFPLFSLWGKRAVVFSILT
jgi:hypothetical protein